MVLTLYISFRNRINIHFAACGLYVVSFTHKIVFSLPIFALMSRVKIIFKYDGGVRQYRSNPGRRGQEKQHYW
jgi:hypothetical protein